MPQRILGIDLGSWSVKAVLIESSFRGFKVEAVREERVLSSASAAPSSESEEEAGDRPDPRRDAQREALERLVADPELRGDMTVVGFRGDFTTTRFITLPFSEPKKVEQILPGELADVLPFDIDDAVFDHHLLKKGEDGSSVSLAAVALRDRVRDQLDLLEEASVEARFLPVDVLQLFNLYTHFLRDDASRPVTPTVAAEDAHTFIQPTPDGPPDARLIVDIGHDRTQVCACSEEGIVHVRVIRAGGKDVTEALQEAYELSWEDAEAGKHDNALVVSARQPATDDATQRVAEVVAKGLRPLIQELRRTIQSIRREKRARVARVDLVGGGSRIKNLANFMAEQLNVPVALGAAVEQVVERHASGDRRSAYAGALAHALRAGQEAPVSKIDLRVDEFKFSGQLHHLRERAPTIAAAAVVLLVLGIVNVVAQFQVAAAKEANIDQQFCSITKKIVGREICEPTIALSVIRQPASELGSFKLPERSAFDVVADVSHIVPSNVAVKLEEVEVTTERARLSGETVSFDGVDKLVSAIGADRCVNNVKKGKLRKKSDGKGVEFQLSLRLGCSK